MDAYSYPALERTCSIDGGRGEVLAHASRARDDSGAAVAAQGADVVGAALAAELGGVGVVEGAVAAVEDEEEAAERGVERAGGGGRAAQQGEERAEAAEAHETAGLHCSSMRR